jgi:hypothetical protein
MPMMNMLNEDIIATLKANWGDKATCMACFAEVKFMDELSGWSCYILAMNPDNEDEIACIVKGFDVELCTWSLKELYCSYNVEGESPCIDHEYRRVRASELFKRLSNDR